MQLLPIPARLPSRAKSWVLRVQVDKGREDIGLGSLGAYGLAEARDRSRELRKAAKQGRDPIAERDKDRKAPPSFKLAARSCHDAKRPRWSDKTPAAFLSSLPMHVHLKIGNFRVDGITERDVTAALSPVWHTKPAFAKKLRHRIGLVLDFSKASGWRNEATPRQSLSALLSKQQEGGNFPSMPYEELPALVAKVEGKAETIGRLALFFTTRPASMMQKNDSHPVAGSSHDP